MTKLHEETFREYWPKTITHFNHKAPKGEFVLLEWQIKNKDALESYYGTNAEKVNQLQQELGVSAVVPLLAQRG